jgi:phenylalanyl-tRNA synthetase beta chain
MCIAGVYGGFNSGVTEQTKNIFLESAWFNPVFIRKTSLLHNLRTDAASRFEKGTDISNTVTVLQRAALLIQEYAGGSIEGFIDVYPDPLPKKTVRLEYSYLKKLSGKFYEPSSIKTILLKLGFEIMTEDADAITISVPYSKPDVSLQADIVEEIMRIDGLDNIIIPSSISISPSIEKEQEKRALKERIAGVLSSGGFYEIFTNSIVNSSWYEAEGKGGVKMINSLSSELDMMRPYMLQSGLEVISYNINRKNRDLRFYEFGKTYEAGNDSFIETNHLSLYVTGNITRSDWKHKEAKTDFFAVKGETEKILKIAGADAVNFPVSENNHLKYCIDILVKNKRVGILGEVNDAELKKHDIKQPVFYIDIIWEELLTAIAQKKETYREISKFPAAQRDLSIVIDKDVPFSAIQKATAAIRIDQLASVELFDVFESEKLGADKKSMAINYTFTDDTRTLTDKDIDGMMNKLISSYEKELKAEIRKQ